MLKYTNNMLKMHKYTILLLTLMQSFRIMYRIMINPLAQELNAALEGTTPGSLLSDLGVRMYFPKGIIAQSAEARKKGKTANATIGMTVSNGTPVILPAIQEKVSELSPRELVAYAPTAGNPDLRNAWKEQILLKNPLLKGKNISLPVLVPGLTAGISYLSDLFLGNTDTLLAGNPSWDNYCLVVEARRNASYRQFEMFNENGFNLKAFEEAMKDEAKKGFVRVILNFPQNPSGYSPTVEEAASIVKIIKEIAETGVKVMVWCDDAYFGLAYEDNIEKQSLFAYLADLHENVFAVKIDGPTKEDFVWGFRCGFLTFAGKGLSDNEYDALIKKLMGVIRSSVSCASTVPQSLLLQAYKNPDINAQKLEFRKMLERRYKLVRKFTDSHKSDALYPLPYNSGYFMSFHLNKVNAELLRQDLLNNQGIGTIAIDASTLRVAFSSLDEEKIESVYSAIYKTAEELSRA